MAIGWVSLLKTVPWADVISTAPTVAEGAKKLWTAATRKSSAPPPAESDETSPATTTAPPPPVSEVVAHLTTRLDAAEASMTELHEQLVASVALISSLAGQNKELVAHVEANRVRLLWLTAALVVVLAVAAGGFTYLLMR